MENQLQNLLQHSLLQSDLIAMIVISLFATAQVIVLVQVGKRFFPVLRQIDEVRRIMQEPKIVLESHAADLSLEHLRSPLDLLARLLLTRKDLELDGEACRYQIQKQEAAIAGSDDELSESRQISRAQEDDAIASAFAGIDMPLVVTNDKDEIVFANDAFQAAVQGELPSLIGLPCAPLIKDHDVLRKLKTTSELVFRQNKHTVRVFDNTDMAFECRRAREAFDLAIESELMAPVQELLKVYEKISLLSTENDANKKRLAELLDEAKGPAERLESFLSGVSA